MIEHALSIMGNPRCLHQPPMEAPAFGQGQFLSHFEAVFAAHPAIGALLHCRFAHGQLGLFEIRGADVNRQRLSQIKLNGVVVADLLGKVAKAVWIGQLASGKEVSPGLAATIRTAPRLTKPEVRDKN